MAVSTIMSIRKPNTLRPLPSIPCIPHTAANANGNSLSLCSSTLKKKPHSIQCKAMAQSRPMKRNSALVESATTTTTDIVEIPPSAREIVREFYSLINRREIDPIGELIAENCVYEDLIFPQPFVGRKDILLFFQKFSDSLSTDLQFVVDDITSQDASAAGVTWHMEWRGKPFPFSKGCSFYRCELFNGKRQIIYARDSVEPATKPGDMALVAIKAVTSLLERFPQLADRF